MKERFTIPQGGKLSEQFKGNSQDFDFGSNQYCRYVVCGVQGVFFHRQGRGGAGFPLRQRADEIAGIVNQVSDNVNQMAETVQTVAHQA